jgi:hypothetical protein
MNDSPEGPSPRPPVPVRELMASKGTSPVDEKEQAGPAPGTSEGEGVVRRIHVEGGSWLVRQTGATRTGTGGDAGAILLRVSFQAEGNGEEAVREALVAGASLATVTEEALDLAFRAARPVSK